MRSHSAFYHLAAAAGLLCARCLRRYCRYAHLCPGASGLLKEFRLPLNKEADELTAKLADETYGTISSAVRCPNTLECVRRHPLLAAALECAPPKTRLPRFFLLCLHRTHQYPC